MDRLLARLRRGNAGLLVLGLGSATLALFMLGVTGFFALSTNDDTDLGVTLGVEAGDGSDTTTGDATTGDTTPDGSSATTVVGTDPANPGTAGTRPGATTTSTQPGRKFVEEAPPAPGEAPLPPGGNATGVTATHIKYGVHAPVTFNKTPVPLGGPVIRGIKTYVEYLNTNGGVNGRQIDLRIADDEFTTGGAQTAARRLIHDDKVFFIAGTMGVDQVVVVAKEAQKANMPYFAGGGHEPLFKSAGVHQILGSYDTHVVQLADFLGTDPAFKGKVIGTLTSNTPQIAPVVAVFDEALRKHGMSVRINKTVEKPETQSALGYQDHVVEYKSKGVQVLVPITDPLNTSGLIRTCGYSDAQDTCGWTYAFSNFAHEGETALAVFNDEWGRKRVRGLSGWCYPNAPDADLGDTAKCASMGIAKQQFNAMKGAGAWTSQMTDADGASVGYNSGPGYQWMFWKKAMIDQGTNVTRERLLAAVHRYNGYADLVTGPITYKGSSNYAHGAEKMAVFEAQTGHRYKMVSAGLVDGF